MVLRAVAPRRADRFTSASEFREALAAVTQVRVPPTAPPIEVTPKWESGVLALLTPHKPNFNPFVSALLTMYSQSPLSNAGTRGLDEIGRATYVRTLLDDKLRPAVFAGHFRLVAVTGNAGDGKTAFIQQIERATEVAPTLAKRSNGSEFTWSGRRFMTNYDGSQDEEDKGNDEVLREFFEPFEGDDSATWPIKETRIIAINEGRLVDFLTEHESPVQTTAGHHPCRAGWGRARGWRRCRESQPAVGGCRAAVAYAAGHNLRPAHQPPHSGEILGTVRGMRHPRPLLRLPQRAHPDGSRRRSEGRGTATDTLRDHAPPRSTPHHHARSAVGARFHAGGYAGLRRDPRFVRELRRRDPGEDPRGFLLQLVAWWDRVGDRLLALLGQIDVGEATNPDIDRALDYLPPNAREMARFAFAQRGDYDTQLLERLYRELPRDASTATAPGRVLDHRNYVAMLRRRQFFERRDENWKEMLAYRTADDFWRLVTGDTQPEMRLDDLLMAINRGEGLSDPKRLGNALALRMRFVDRGTVRSYRLFPGENFNLGLPASSKGHFVENIPQSLRLVYTPPGGQPAELIVDLDMYEMLSRLNDGYRPSLEELQGYYLTLTVFKNVLSSAPYQEVLLSRTGHDFYRIEREDEGTLKLEELTGEAV